MISFDRHLWWNRAWERHRRALQKCSAKEAAEATSRWARDAMSVTQLEVLVEWCKKKKLNVEFGKKVAAVFDQNTRTMTVSGRLPPERQVHLLLHECGHYLVGDDPRFRNGYPLALDPKASRSFEHRLACLEEEIEAWNRGWKLSVRLGLNLDPVAFDRTRAECLKSYVIWVSKKK